MVNNPKRKFEYFFNLLCSNLLKHMRYTVPQDSYILKPGKHAIIFVFCIVMMVVSLMAIKTFAIYTFAFHALSLAYQVSILYYKRKAYNKEFKQAATGTRSTPQSPYHLQFIILITVVTCLLLIFLVTLTVVQNIDYTAPFLYVIVASILLTFVQQIIDAIVVLYNAKVELNI